MRTDWTLYRWVGGGGRDTLEERGGSYCRRMIKKRIVSGFIITF